MFVDKVRVYARAGNGGNGCVSFRREKYVDRGGPDGGDGGKGGDIVLVADKNVNDLSDYYFSPRLIAPNGGHGRGKNCAGRNGKDRIFRVPVGTQVFRLSAPVRQLGHQAYRPAAATDDFKNTAMIGIPYTPGRAKQAIQHRGSGVPAAAGSEEHRGEDAAAASTRELIADLVEDGQRFVLAKGGRGGRGNAAFKSPTHQAPREFEYGEPGEELYAELELKTLADVGLVGYPNAGKSTLLSKLTRAHPKIAAYPFTTLAPNVGLLDFDDYRRITIADIPGLIEGAHTGKGLGHDFLRHIERCRLLLILLDMAGVDGRKPWDDYRQLLRELELYNPELLNRPRLVVANKMDLPAAKKNLATFKRKVAGASRSRKRATASGTLAARSILEISAQQGTGLDKLKLALRQALA